MANKAILISSAAAFAAAAAFATPAHAADRFPNDLVQRDGAIILPPLSPWNIDFGENRCRLARFFGTEDNRHLLMFEQAAPRPQFGITFAGPEVRAFQNARRFLLGMERDEPAETKENFARADIEGVGEAIIITTENIGPSYEDGMLRNAGINLAEAATIDRFVLNRGGRVLSFETGDMMPPFQALNSCTSSLLTDWGLDAEKHQAYTPAEWKNEAAIKRRIVDRYPSDALNTGEQAIFRLRVIIEIDGSVSDCHLENSTEITRLNSPACEAMMNARFDPALDADGAPMRSFYATTITYRIN